MGIVMREHAVYRSMLVAWREQLARMSTQVCAVVTAARVRRKSVLPPACTHPAHMTMYVGP